MRSTNEDPNRLPNPEPIERQRACSEQPQHTGHPNLVPLLRGHLAETLYQAGETEADLDESAALAAETIAETDRTGQTRSAIIAHALTAAIGTRRGSHIDAAHHAREAVRMLEVLGDLPAMRTEEILWRCAVGLEATDSATAGLLQARARAVVERKAASLADPERRERYLALPLNRDLLRTESKHQTGANESIED
jgi:hypothetical protein